MMIVEMHGKPPEGKLNDWLEKIRRAMTGTDYADPVYVEAADSKVVGPDGKPGSYLVVIAPRRILEDHKVDIGNRLQQFGLQVIHQTLREFQNRPMKQPE